MDYPEEGPPATSADPTQRLLTALGRFQRQVNRAEGGAPDHQWIDECMEQLIEGIAISHENDWQDVKEALTDAARILQSYEEASAASQAVPFLQDSYEILCLMVGDIIVDNVRSGVMNKWRQRYNHALNDIARHGVALIDDEADEATPQPANIVRFAQSNAPVADRAFPFADPDVEAVDDSDVEAETVVVEVANGLPDMHGGIEEAAEEIAAWRAEEEEGFGEEGAEAAVVEVAPASDVMLDADDDDDEDLDDVAELVEDEELAEDADALEAVDEIAAEDGEDFSSDDDVEDDGEDAGEDLAVEGEADDAISDLEDEAEDGEAIDETETPLPALDEVLFEIPADEATSDDAEEAVLPEPVASNVLTMAVPVGEDPAEDASLLFEAPSQTPRVSESAQATAEPVRDADDDVQAMLRSAQQSMSRGDVASAKVVALQVAVKMAELEVKRAKEGMRAAEGRLEDTSRAIEIASEAVRRTENGMRDVEEQMAQRELEFQEKRESVGKLREEISTVHGSIASIDEQIKALEAQRDVEERNLTALQDQLEQGLSLEGRIQADLDMLTQEEEAAREAQEAAKQRVRDLQRERLSRESDINDSRNAMKLQERSVEDIQRTLQQVTAGPEAPVQESDLLF